jgi:hypothetical protein
MLATKRIRTRSCKNVETERLQARLEFMRHNLVSLARQCEQKSGFRDHVREIVNIERELTFRGVKFTPVTDGCHLSVSVHSVRVMMPAPSRKVG